MLKVEKYADIMQSAVVPRDTNSPLFQQVDQGLMPYKSPKLPAAEIATLKDWILQGAPNWDARSQEAHRTFVSEAQIIQLIISDLKKQNERSLPYLRYYSIVHLYNALASNEDLEQYRVGLSKLVNSLSTAPNIVKPFPINAERTILRIDLRDFKWDDAIWKTIVNAYPYGARPFSSVIRNMTGADVPYIRADWFVFQASTPPLYHDILRLPSTIRELEAQNGVDVERDFQEEHNFFRAGMPVSKISDHNRIIERHDSRNGAYWRSFDFKTSAGEDNILKNPLTFKAAGGEIIFNLPNGLQAYLLADANGKRLDGPANPDIVSDKTGGIAVQVTNGRSCMGCHYKGMQDTTDHVRAAILNSVSFPSREKVLAVYPTQTELNNLFRGDDGRFQQAVLASGGRITSDEPINELSKKYHQALTLDLAAAELGLQTSILRQKIREDQTLGSLGFGQLLEAGGVYQRDTWEGNFSELAVLLASAHELVDLGERYLNGRAGLPHDTEKAVGLFIKGAGLGDARGMADLGEAYELGYVPLARDGAQALSLYRKAAQLNGGRGLMHLGGCYMNGRLGVPKDVAQAVSLYRKGADVGDEHSMTLLGLAYESGDEGLPKDDAQAVILLRKAAELGDVSGIIILGGFYEFGQDGLPKDDAQAVILYRKAVQLDAGGSGGEEAKRRLRELGQ